MPFTPTHTLAAVPLGWLWRRPAVFSSLVIGSMVPDWPLYVPFVGPEYDLTHSVPGLFTACLPLGVLSALYFQFALKRPLVELLPQFLQRRMVRFVYLPAKPSIAVLLTIVAALLLGSGSHVLWDSFTHGGAWGVQLLPQLKQVMLAIDSARFTGYQVLQHGSTFVGLPLFLILAWAWCRNAETSDVPNPVFPPRSILVWRLLLVAIPVITSLLMLWQLADATTTRSIFRTLYYGVTRAGLILLVAMLILGVHYRVMLRTVRPSRLHHAGRNA